MSALPDALRERPSRRVRWAALDFTVLAYVLAGASLVFVLAAGWSRARAGTDLGQYLAASRYWAAGGNPYDSGAYQRDFASLGLPHRWNPCPLLPMALVMLWPMANGDWVLVAQLSWLASFAGLVFVLCVMDRVVGARWTLASRCILAVMLLQSRLLTSIAYRGQLSLICVAAACAAILLSRRNRPVLAGVALTVCCLKYSLAIFPVIVLLRYRYLRTLAVAAALVAALNVAGAWQIGFGEVARTLPAAAAEFARWNEGVAIHQSTDWRSILSWTLGANSGTVGVLNKVLVVGVLALLLWRAVRPPVGERHHWWVAFAAMLSLTIVYHRNYDAVLAFVVAAALWTDVRASERRRSVAFWIAGLMLVLVLFFFAPSGISEKLSSQFARSHIASWLAPINAWASLLLLVAVARLWLAGGATGSMNEDNGSAGERESAVAPT